jgi:hypothetical protein
VWRRSSVTNIAEPVVLDIDATLVEVHSENKEGTVPTYKRGFGFHPMLCFADATGEALAARLRPGNAGANTVTDHLGVLDDAVAQLPAEVTAGHRPGDPAQLVNRRVVVRADSAGCTHGFVWGCRDRNIGFAVVARSNRQVAAAISRTYTTTATSRWAPARHQNGEVRCGAQVADLTDLVDLADWPEGTRLIVRREPLHPGAQQTLLPSTEFRYWGHRAGLGVRQSQTSAPLQIGEQGRAELRVSRQAGVVGGEAHQRHEPESLLGRDAQAPMLAEHSPVTAELVGVAGRPAEHLAHQLVTWSRCSVLTPPGKNDDSRSSPSTRS